jgi:hypothetical protein
VQGAELPLPRMPPTLGANTDELLGTLLGLEAGRIAALRAKKVI